MAARFEDFWKKKEADPEQALGDYLIKNTIGVGAYGRVKLGIHKETNHLVAVKQLSLAHIKEMKAEERISREIRNLRMFHHPHIIELYQILRTPEQIFMIMEYASRGELFHFINSKKQLGETESRKYFQQIVSAVHYCHHHNVVHRDLKPENLLLDAEGNVKVADFGLSVMVTDGDFLASSCGSPNYAAPEVLSGRLYAGPEVDVWSCGVILYALLVGNLPFDDENQRILFQKITSGKFSIPKSVSPSPADLIRKMLRVDPIARIPLSQVIEHPWFSKDLPYYLFPPPAERHSSTIDLKLASLVAEKLNLDVMKVKEALLEENGMEPCVIAYKVLKDREEQESAAKREQKTRNRRKECRRARQACLRPGQKFCRPDCNMCPRWGASECLFAKFIPSLSHCDTCKHLGGHGCVFFEQTKPSHGSSNSSGKKEQPSCQFGESQTGPPPSGDAESSSSENVRQIEDLLPPPLIPFPPPTSKNKLSLIKTRFPAVSNIKSRWHLGIRASCPPSEIMLTVYKVLKKCGFSWRIINPYHVILRAQQPDNQEINVELQLYEMEKLPASGTYLIDFKDMINPREQSSWKRESCEWKEGVGGASGGVEDSLEEVKVPSSRVIQFFQVCTNIIQGLNDDDDEEDE